MTDAARGVRPRLAAALLLVWAVAWSVPGGQVSEDTKNDLYVAPWRFLARAAHLWDPQVTWGVLQNQGYGYLFPMGPFFGAVSRGPSGLGDPAALVEPPPDRRAPRELLPAHRAAGRGAHVEGPRCARLHPQPAGPLHGRRAVLGDAARGAGTGDPAAAGACRPGPDRPAPGRRALRRRRPVLRRGQRHGHDPRGGAGRVVARDPGRAGGALRPPGGGPPRSSPRARGGSGPLVVLGRWSPPFLDWIERSADVVREIDLLDVARGTTHWLEFVVTSGGQWWPAGYADRHRPAAHRRDRAGRRSIAGRPRSAAAYRNAGSCS